MGLWLQVKLLQFLQEIQKKQSRMFKTLRLYLLVAWPRVSTWEARRKIFQKDVNSLPMVSAF
jgi:hypothetical protein